MRTELLLGLALVALLLGTANATTIFGFNSPYDVAISPTQNYLYVTNGGNNTVSIVASSSNTIVGTITGFDSPEGIVITPNGTFAYVANFGNNEMLRISTATNTITDATAGFDLPKFISLSPDGKTAYVTNLGNGTVSVVDLTQQSGPIVTPVHPSYDLNQPMTFTATWPATSLPYTANWFITQGSSIVYSKQYTGIAGLSSSLSLSASALGTGAYAANVVLTDGVPSTTSSLKDAFTINSALAPGSPLPNSPTITSGQSITLTAAPSGGTGPYSYVWYVSLTSPCSSSWIRVGSGPSITVIPSANLYYCYVATDSATTPESATSGSDLVTVTSGGGGGGGGGGGSGGGGGGGGSVSGGGGGVQRPSIIEVMSNQTTTLVNMLAEQTDLNITSSVPSQNEDIILNIASLNTFNITLHGERLNFTTNFISPTSTGMTINNQMYVLSQNNTFMINQRNYNYTLSVELSNISILPVLHTVELTVKSLPNPINMTVENFTTALFSNQTLAVQNLTSSQFLPAVPNGYEKQLVQNVSVSQTPGTPEAGINTTIYFAIKYKCGLPSYDEIPLILSNYSWAQVSSFVVKPNDCAVTFASRSDPILALTRYVGPSNATRKPVTTTIPANTVETVSTTSITYPTLALTPAVMQLALAVMAIAIVAFALWIILRRYRARPPSKPRKEVRGRAKPQARVPKEDTLKEIDRGIALPQEEQRAQRQPKKSKEAREKPTKEGARPARRKAKRKAAARSSRTERSRLKSINDELGG